MDQAYVIRIEAMAERARRGRGCFLPPEEPPDRERAREYLQDGVGPAVALYREVTMGNTNDSIRPPVRRQLNRVLNEWLELYAGCFGVHLEVDASVARAADIFAECQDLGETARKLTGIPTETGVMSRSRRDTLPGRLGSAEPE